MNNILKRYLASFTLGLFILSVPLLLITSNVRWAFNDLRLYKFGFERNEVVANTGFELSELMLIARDIRDYFNTDNEFLEVIHPADKENNSLFNDREIIHMRDVKVLLGNIYSVQEILAGYIAIYILWLLYISRGRHAQILLRQLTLGCIATVGLLVFAGTGTAIGFDAVFEAFHVLSFSDGSWSFDPRSNYLTRLFTEAFFLQASLAIVVATILEAIFITSLATFIERRYYQARDPN